MSEPVSMPWSAPVFPPPPHSWHGVRSVLVPFDPDPGGVERALPPALEPLPGPGIVALLSYGWGANVRIRPFNEAVVLVPARCDGTEGNYVPFIYVTTDEALIPGREAAGWPKKLADITWERSGERIEVAVARWGETLLAFEGVVAAGEGPAGPGGTGAAGWLELLAAAGLRPTFNYKLIPGPGHEIEVEEVTSTSLEVLPSRIETGTGSLACSSSVDDPVADVVRPVDGPFVAMVSDNTIPSGTVLRRIEGRVSR